MTGVMWVAKRPILSSEQTGALLTYLRPCKLDLQFIVQYICKGHEGGRVFLIIHCRHLAIETHQNSSLAGDLCAPIWSSLHSVSIMCLTGEVS